jgi:integrase
MSKAPAGTPQIKNSNGRLQIVISLKKDKKDKKDNRKYFSLNLSESKQNRNYAEMIAKQIQNDILAGHFDPTFKKYERKSSTSEPEVETGEDTTLRELWDRYTNYKRQQLSPSTIAKDFGCVSTYIDKFPVSTLADAVAVRDYLNLETTPNVTKRILTQLAACCRWAVSSKLLTINPFLGMAADIKLPKGRGEEARIDPFSPEERDLIIKHLRSHNSEYVSLVEFMFRTGCRPSEAIGIQWRHISLNYKIITFEQTRIDSEDGPIIKQGLKTQDKRSFPCGEKLQKFLMSIEPESKNSEAFLFRSVKGKLVDWCNFSNKTWRPTLIALGIKHRNPYQMRHSYITFCIDSGMDAKDVAKLVGNSPEMIYRHYAGVKKNLIAPDI